MIRRRLTEPTKVKVELLLDSGAFSAWSRKEPIDVYKYIDYLKKHEDLLHGYVNLDVIVGKLGVRRTFKELDEAARIGYENLNTIKKAGLRPMPVYHQHESLNWLARMIEDGEQYIGLSSAKDLWAKQQREWLDEMFSLLTDSKGRPLIRTHGFGITNPDLVKRYPWYTVDSTTWSLCAGYGQIIIPQYNNGVWDYLGQSLRIVVSGVEHRSAGNQMRQFEGFVHVKSKEYEEVCKAFMRDVCGVSVTEARYGTTMRRRCMLHYFMGLANALTDVRYTDNKHKGLMSHTGPELRVREALEKRKAVAIGNPKIMFASTLSREWSKLMNDVGADTRLLSYYELKSRPPGTLMKYVSLGAIGSYVKSKPRDKKSMHYRNYRRLHIADRMEKGTQDGTHSPVGKAETRRPGLERQRTDPRPEPLVVSGRHGNGVQRSDRHSDKAQDGLRGSGPRKGLDRHVGRVTESETRRVQADRRRLTGEGRKHQAQSEGPAD